jgi:NAD(P)H-nitrite reductase large subunit
LTEYSYSYIVCKCKEVSLGEIIYAIKNQNATIIQDLQDKTDAGTVCKCCISKNTDTKEPKMQLYLKDILKKFNNE